MSDSLENVVIAKRIADFPEPLVPSSIENCFECEEECWIGNDMVEQIIQQTGRKHDKVCCTRCALPLVDDGSILANLPEEARASLVRYLKDEKK